MDLQAPDELLETWLPAIPRGRALDLGAGEGEVAVWLAHQGFEVEAWERDPAVFRRLVRYPRIHATCVDICLAEEWPEECALVLALAVLHFVPPADLPGLARRMIAALAPGGFLVAKAFTTDDPAYDGLRQGGIADSPTGGHERPDSPEAMHFFAPGELRTLFAALETRAYEESRWVADSIAAGYRASASLVAMRPEGAGV
jgi:SAM-dependent methyltransferase